VLGIMCFICDQQLSFLEILLAGSLLQGYKICENLS